jgi:hypothetical protein
MTVLQILLQHEKDLTRMYDSDTKVALAILDTIRKTGTQLLKIEKQIIKSAFVNGGYCSKYNSGLNATEYYEKEFKTEAV